MGTFNAGAIEAKLTLDRSAFTRELNEARAQAQKFQQDKIKPEIELRGKEKLDKLAAQLKKLDGESVDIRLDTSGTAVEDIKRLEAQIKRMSGKDIDIDTDVAGLDDLAALESLIDEMDPSTIRIDLDIDRALMELAALEEAISVVDGRNINLDIRLDGEERLAALAVAVEALDGRNIDLDVRSGPGLAGGAASHFSRMQALVAAILILLPLVPPVAASATAAVVGLAAGLTGAAGALGAVAIGLAPAVMNMMQLNEEIQKQQTRLASLKPGTEEYAKQQGKINQLQKEFNKQFGPAAKGLDAVRDAWSGFQKEIHPEAMQIIGAALGTIAAVIPTITPVFKAATPVVLEMLNGITAFVKSDEGQRMVDFFTEFGSRSLQQIINIGGNVLQFFGRLFEAFAPFGTTFLGAIEDVTAAWADWADGLGQTQGFQDFIAYVLQDGPKVWDLIENIIGAFINWGIALAPLGAVALDAFNGIFSFIENMDPSILGAISVALGGAITGILLLVGATAALNVVMAANPIALIVIAIGALVAAIIYLWNNNQAFHDAIVAIWDAIKSAIGAVADWFMNTVVPLFQAAWGAIQGFFAAAWEQIGPIVTGIGEIIGLMAQIVARYFEYMWKFIQPIVAIMLIVITTAFRNIYAVVSAVVNTIWAVIRAVFTTALAFWRAVFATFLAAATGTWNVIRAVIIGVINVIKAVLNAVLAAMKGDWTGAFNYMRAAVTASMNAIRSIISAVINAARSVISTGVNGARSVVTTAFNGMANVIRSALNNALGAVRSVIGNIRGAFSGAAGWLVESGRSIIRGLISGIQNMAGEVGNAVRGVLQRARNLLPFSPAKEGPFSGRGWTLYSGQSIIEGLAQGIRDRAQMLRDATLATVQGAVPDLSLTPQIGRGALAGAGLAQVAGGRTVNVEVTAYNPVEERSSETAVREVTRLAQLGVFDG